MKTIFSKNKTELTKELSKILPKFFDTKKELLIKLHFGEVGNKTAFTPAKIKFIIDAIKSTGLNPTLIDTPVAYTSTRKTVVGYKKFCQQAGYKDLAPVIISNKTVKVKMKDFTVGVCKELSEAKQVLVLSHVKGHPCAGFGGAIKNLAMGGVDRMSKIKQHLLCHPKFIKTCQGCGVCASICPAKAIEMKKGKAKINQIKCWGCSICQIECPHKCLAPRKAIFDDLLAQAATAVIKKLPKKTLYLNSINEITQFCDCENNSGPIVAKDQGWLLSNDAIAIDKDSLKLINQKNKDTFIKHNHKDPDLQLKYTKKYL